jgi:hypothetical protein
MPEVDLTLENPLKKTKIDHNDIEWSCTFDQTQGLRTMIEVVGNILTRINLRLSKSKETDAHFLCIDSIDPQHVCMIQARLNCEKVFGLTDEVNADFCVDSNLFNLCLKGTAQHYSIDIYKKKDNPDIHIRAYETLSNSHQTFFKLPTLLDDSETMQLTDMSYKFTIEIDLGTLRQIVKMSQNLKAQQIDMTVKEPQEKKSGVLRTVFTIGANGDAHHEHSFLSATVQESNETDENRVIRAATDATGPSENANDNLEIKYSDSFSTQYLNFFLKSMERQIITMKLSQNKPLILHYPLGADKSYICFVLAPKTNSD